MALTERAIQSVGGPRGGSTWSDSGNGFAVSGGGTNGPATFTATTTLPGLMAVQTIGRPNPFYLNYGQGLANQDFLDSTQIFQTLYGFQVSSSVVFAAAATLTMTMSVFRTVALLSGAGGNPVTSMPIKAPITQAIPSGSTLTITNSAGTATSLTTSAITPAGATAIPISSVSLAAFADSNSISWQVGNGPAFGWIAPATGTPVFPQGVSVVAPIVAANTSVITAGALPWPAPNGTTTAQAGALPLQAGDTLMLNLVTSSSTVAGIPLIDIEPIIT